MVKSQLPSLVAAQDLLGDKKYKLIDSYWHVIEKPVNLFDSGWF